jgi:hypothetical protein
VLADRKLGALVEPGSITSALQSAPVDVHRFEGFLGSDEPLRQVLAETCRGAKGAR